MATTQLSSKGQVVIPKAVRQAHQWRPGTKFVVEEMSGGILIRPLQTFPPTTLQGGLGCTGYGGGPKTVKEMREGVDEEIGRSWRRRWIGFGEASTSQTLFTWPVATKLKRS